MTAHRGWEETRMEQKELIEQTLQNLKRNNMDAVYVEDVGQLREVVRQSIAAGDTVTFGGSVTLKETGVYDMLRQMGDDGAIDFLDRDLEGADVQDIYRRAFCSDVYLTSANAITKNGWLYNVDGNGNRVAAMIFGPKRVLVIAGCNKIVETKEEAQQRVEKIAAPKNAQRLQLDTPCAKTGECMHCMSDQRICCSYTFLGKQRIKDRIRVILVGEPLGY